MDTFCTILFGVLGIAGWVTTALVLHRCRKKAKKSEQAWMVQTSLVVAAAEEQAKKTDAILKATEEIMNKHQIDEKEFFDALASKGLKVRKTENK